MLVQEAKNWSPEYVIEREPQSTAPVLSWGNRGLNPKRKCELENSVILAGTEDQLQTTSISVNELS